MSWSQAEAIRIWSLQAYGQIPVSLVIVNLVPARVARHSASTQFGDHVSKCSGWVPACFRFASSKAFTAILIVGK